eukprot:m.496750 g.496750  ORF g.496750 m.496750 type:complete len:131 (-) comp57307_c1_seq3:744-1136(-)
MSKLAPQQSQIRLSRRRVNLLRSKLGTKIKQNRSLGSAFQRLTGDLEQLRAATRSSSQLTEQVQSQLHLVDSFLADGPAPSSPLLAGSLPNPIQPERLDNVSASDSGLSTVQCIPSSGALQHRAHWNPPP